LKLSDVILGTHGGTYGISNGEYLNMNNKDGTSKNLDRL
jgi:hypothetical protein